jgi:hypothetical protein
MEQKYNKNIQNLITDLYIDLEFFKTQNIDYDIDTKFNHIKYKKIFSLNNNNNFIYKLPMICDTISMIYNESNRDIKFKIILHGLPICELSIKPKEYLYPLYNNAIFPLFLFETNFYLSIEMENNYDLYDLLIICSNFTNRQRKIITFNNFYYFKNIYNSYDLVSFNNYIFNQNIDNNWISITKPNIIIIKI